MRLILTLIMALSISASAQAAGGKRPALSEQDADLIIKKLEDSGKLDAALERSLQRFGQKQQDAKRNLMEKQAEQRKGLSKNVRKPDRMRDHILGNADAEITLIEFSDMECPFCKRFHGTPEEVVKRLEGKANMVWRHFPLDFHNPVAQHEAEAAECAAKQAGNDAFWNYTNTVMKRTATNGKGMPQTSDKHPLLELAEELKLDTNSFKKCMDEGEMKAHIKEDIEDGIHSGVEGTPAVIIYNNKTGQTEFVNGALPVEALEAAARSVLEK